MVKNTQYQATNTQRSVITSRDAAKVTRYYHEALAEALVLIREADEQTERARGAGTPHQRPDA